MAIEEATHLGSFHLDRIKAQHDLRSEVNNLLCKTEQKAHHHRENGLMSTLNAMHLPAGSLWIKARLHEVNGEGQPDLDHMHSGSLICQY